MVYTREVTRKDIKFLDYWRIMDTQDSNSGLFGFEAAMTVYEETAEDMFSSLLFIAYNETGNPIGFVGFYNLREDRRCQGVRIYIDPINRGHGYGAELVKTCKLLAEENGFKKIFAAVCKDNQKSLRLFKNDNWILDDRKETDGKLFFACSIA